MCAKERVKLGPPILDSGAPHSISALEGDSQWGLRAQEDSHTEMGFIQGSQGAQEQQGQRPEDPKAPRAGSPKDCHERTLAQSGGAVG